jgi:aminopeptidase N
LAKTALTQMITKGAAPDQGYLNALKALFADDDLDPDFAGHCLALATEDDLAQTLASAGQVPDPQAIWTAREAMRDAMADTLGDRMRTLFDRFLVTEAYRPDPDQVGRRALTNGLLSLITRREGGGVAQAQFAAADNMTLQLGALSALLASGLGAEELAAFADQWGHERLVMDKWFMVQVAHAAPDRAAAVAQALTERDDFTMTNPNRFRAVFGALSMNHAGFHHGSGAGYRLMADWLMKLDPANPQTTARMCSAFQSWRRYDADRQGMIEEQLNRIAGMAGLSRDTGEMVGRILRG